MKTHILRLGSIIPHGVGGSEAGMMELIYSFLLQEFNSDVYNHISINQIGEDLKEFVIKQPNNRVHVNIRYRAYEDFELKHPIERNQIRLNVIHESLLKIAKQEGKLEISKIEAIKQIILKNNFSFEFLYKTFINKKDETVVAKILIRPEHNQCNFLVAIEENGIQKSKQTIYVGLTTAYYVKDFFSNGKWNSLNEFIIKPKKEFEIHLNLHENSCKLINLTSYDNPLHYQMMRADISKEEKDKAYKNWIHSLPPGFGAIVNYEAN